MALGNESNLKDDFAAFSKGASLELLLPVSSEPNVSTLLQDGLPEDIARIPQRRTLFFDEKANVILILRCSSTPDLAHLLPSLDLHLAAHATDAVPQGSGNAASASGKYDLTARIIPASQGIHLHDHDGNEYIVWHQKLHLPRPRVRLQRPAIYFTAHVTLSAQTLDALNRRERSYLKSFEPLPGNVLEPLRFDPAFYDSKVYLSEDKITKVTPAAVVRAHEDVKPIRAVSKRALAVVPPLFTRIRYSALPDAVMASLHIETSQFVPGTLLLRHVEMKVPDAEAETLCPLASERVTYAGDENVMLYKVSRSGKEASQVSPVLVKIEAVAFLDKECQTEIEVNWQTQVDLSHTAPEPVFRWSRPLSSSAQSYARASVQGAERPSTADSNQKSSIVETGVIFNFTSTPTTVRNQDFALSVQCINRSDRQRRFALVVLQPKRPSTKKLQQQLQESNAEDSTNLITSIFDAPLPEQPRAPDVLDLNPDVRIGPLPPGACFETQMRFRAVATGVLDLGVARIVDLDTTRTVDVKDLPDVIALERAPEGGRDVD